MIRGSCLCGGVCFEVARTVGPFELCHCSRCRKSCGSAFVSGVGVKTSDYRLIQGAELIRTYQAPVVERPPGYSTSFCGRCGSPVPNPSPHSAWFEIAAGLFDDDPGTRPDKHIFVEYRAPWFAITDELPQMTKEGLVAFRRAHQRPG